MQLLSLTLDGFKSFAQKTTIKFEPGMTGIVGPNGSGKSNIIEAIRWVMGEQSAKQLRGDKMADVIFNGSADRKPLNRALVSITLDNSDHYLASDYTELTITRKLYRNGDSEYQINGNDVRLKDITDLFMDSGLGRESFSIISQGRVAAIFNGKPTDRRGIIETVAGVAKYKKNKDAAQKRLDATMDNLNRVNDIISELSRQLEPLADESALAKDYLEQKKKFDLLDRTQTVRQYDAQHELFDRVNAKYQQANSLVSRYGDQTKQAAAELANLKQQRTKLLRRKDDLQQTILQQTQAIAELNNQQSVSSVRHEQQNAEKQRLAKQQQELAAQYQKLSSQQAALKDQIASHQKAVQEHQDDLKQARQMSSKERIAALNRQLDQLREHQIELMQKLTTIHNQQAFLDRSHEQNLSQRAQSTNDLHAKIGQQKELADEQEKMQAKVTALQQKADQLTSAQNDERRQLEQASQQYQQTQRAWYEALGDVHSTKNRIKNYRALSAEYAGYYQGVKNVLRHRQQFTGLAGAVSELLNVPAKLTVAIETVLGSQLQQLVVDSQATGKRIINYLVKNRGGRVTILPLDTLSQRRQVKMPQAAALPGFVGYAAELVHYEPRYQLVVNYLLGSTVVADNLDHAADIARMGHHRLRVVTLDGQLINASGAMTGGANRHRQQGLLTQKQVGRQLDELLHQQEDQTSKLERQVADLKKEQDRLQSAVAQSQDRLHACQADLHDAQTSQQVLADQEQTVANQVAALQNQIAQQDSQAQNYQERARQFADQEQAVNEKLTKIKDNVQTINQQVHDLANNESAQSQQLHQMEKWLAVAAERSQQYQRQSADINAQLASLRKDQAGVARQLAAVERELQDHSTTAETAGEALKQAQERLKTAKTDRQQCSGQLNELEASLTTQDNDYRRLQELRQAALNDTNQLNAQRVRCEATIDQYLSHLNEQYQMTIDEARQNTSQLDDHQLAIQLKLLKRGLDDLGDVNVGAIEEYQRVKEHYDFLKGQQDDLLAARAQLNQTMQEMDSQVKQRFVTAYQQVSAAFDKTFQQIFGGGHAKLELTDPHDLLTTGIDIIAQPPGKKTQHLSLLSGGERALTAITLLFAILKVRPVPFAILDEPEAALDEVNVQRFANYLNRFGTQGPQFIVITHRKGTMMGADVLYGVTMQESGVSKMVSVDVVDTLENNK